MAATPTKNDWSDWAPPTTTSVSVNGPALSPSAEFAPELASRLARLTFLLVNHPIPIPQMVAKYLPGGDWLQALSNRGPGSSDVDLEALARMIELGEKWGAGTKAEAIDLIKAMVDENLVSMTLDIQERTRVYQNLDRLGIGALEETEVLDLGDPQDTIEPMPKFDTGFEPLDIITGGFYQGLWVILGAPGTGKTSLLLSWMETLRLADWPGGLLYVENEIPGRMMRARMSPLRGRTKFGPNDKLICGPWTVQDILDYINEHPDPNRIIFFDSPDVGAGSANQERRFQLESEYIKLISVKKRSAMVVVSSWPNRSQRLVTHMYQVSESVSKAWYADGIIGINPDINGLHSIVLKNRFGPQGQQCNFGYDYSSLQWSAPQFEASVDENGNPIQALSDWSGWEVNSGE